MLNQSNRINAPLPALSLASLAVVVSYAWILLLWHLSVFWRVLPDYGYGWAVPLLGIALILRRRNQLPPPTPRSSPAAFCALMISTLLLLPLRLILDANLDWRPAVWVLAIIVVVLTLCAVYLARGKGWLEVLAFPILFTLAGVPWPGRLEIPVTTGLMQFGAFVSTELLNAVGIAAYQRGSVVETAAGLIGVDEACSGIKSLQTMVAVGLFLSDFTAWRGGARFLVVMIGAALATLANLVRILVLAWAGSQAGPGGVDRWHNTAGTIAFGAACVALIAIVRWLPAARSWSQASPSPAAGQAPWPSWLAIGLAVCVLWAGATELVRLSWFPPYQAIPGARWTADWPRESSGAKATPLQISDEVRNQLQCDVGKAVSWSDQPGTEWVGYFFEWRRGLRAYFARSQHSPEICLPATGRHLAKDLGFFNHEAFGRIIRVRHLVFEDEAGPLNVFFIMDGSAVGDNDEQLQASSVARRLRGVLERRKGADRRSLELIAVGYPTPELARQEAQRWLSTIIRPAKTPVTPAEAPVTPSTS